MTNPNIHEIILGKLIARLDLAIKKSDSPLDKLAHHSAYKNVRGWYNELVTGTPDPDKTTVAK